MRKLPVALGLYSVRATLFSDLRGTLGKVADMGYDGVEFYGPFSALPETILLALAECKLDIAGWHVPIDALEGRNFEPTLAYLGAVGAPAAVVPHFAAETAAEWAAFALRMKAVAQKLDGAGMYLGYHNHAHEFSQRENGKTMWEVLWNDLPGVFAQIDTGNGLKGGMDPIAELERFQGRIYSTHFKPWKKGAAGGGSDCLFGADDQDLAKMVELAQSAGAKWHIIEFENDNTYSQMGGAREALRSFKGVVG